MGIFYERRETTADVTIRYKYHPLLYVAIGVLFLPPGHTLWRSLLFLAAVVFIIVFFADVWRANAEVRKAMKKGGVKLSGSKLSFKKPLTVVINKTT